MNIHLSYNEFYSIINIYYNLLFMVLYGNSYYTNSG